MEGFVMDPKEYDIDWWKTLEVIGQYLRTFRDMNGAPLAYVMRKQLVTTAEAGNKLNGCNTINKEMIERAPIVVAGIVCTIAALEADGPFNASYLTDWATAWAKLTSTFEYSNYWTYCKVGKRKHNIRKEYLAFCDHYLGPNNVDHMTYEFENILQNVVYHG